MKSESELQQEAQRKMKEIIMTMNGLSEEGFSNRMHNDPYFHKGFKVLVNLFIEAKF